MQTAAVFTVNVQLFHLVLFTACDLDGRHVFTKQVFGLGTTRNLQSKCIKASAVTLETSTFDKLFVGSFFSLLCYRDYNK